MRLVRRCGFAMFLCASADSKAKFRAPEKLCPPEFVGVGFGRGAAPRDVGAGRGGLRLTEGIERGMSDCGCKRRSRGGSEVGVWRRRMKQDGVVEGGLLVGGAIPMFGEAASWTCVLRSLERLVDLHAPCPNKHSDGR